MMAPVGQPSRQRRHVPHPSATGSGDGPRSAVVSTDPRRNQLPRPGNRMLAFLPYHPSPARWAAARSTRLFSSADTIARWPAVAEDPRDLGEDRPQPGVVVGPGVPGDPGLGSRRRVGHRRGMVDRPDDEGPTAGECHGGIGRARRVPVRELHAAVQAGGPSFLEHGSRAVERLRTARPDGVEPRRAADVHHPLAEPEIGCIRSDRRCAGVGHTSMVARHARVWRCRTSGSEPGLLQHPDRPHLPEGDDHGRPLVALAEERHEAVPTDRRVLVVALVAVDPQDSGPHIGRDIGSDIGGRWSAHRSVDRVRLRVDRLRSNSLTDIESSSWVEQVKRTLRTRCDTQLRTAVVDMNAMSPIVAGVAVLAAMIVLVVVTMAVESWPHLLQRAPVRRHVADQRAPIDRPTALAEPAPEASRPQTEVLQPPVVRAQPSPPPLIPTSGAGPALIPTAIPPALATIAPTRIPPPLPNRWATSVTSGVVGSASPSSLEDALDAVHPAASHRPDQRSTPSEVRAIDRVARSRRASRPAEVRPPETAVGSGTERHDPAHRGTGDRPVEVWEEQIA